jgi:phosphate transport system permease protein
MSGAPPTTTLRVVSDEALDAAEAAADKPRPIVTRRSFGDQVFVQGVRSTGFLVLAITGSIGVFLGIQAYPTFKAYGWGFLTEYRWSPSQDVIGISGMLIGTIEVALLALVFAIPLSILTALFISDWAPGRLKPTLVRLVDMMAAVPGIVFGLWVLFVIQPHATQVAHWVSKYFGWIPIFKVRTDVDYPIWNQLPGYPSYAGSAFIASIAVTMMIFPMATAVMREVFDQAPAGEKEAALALGATRWAMVRTVVLPFGRSGIVGGSMLALGRALGETISVVLVLSIAFERKINVLESGQATISASIASFYSEATPAQLSALLTAGFVLFCMTLLVNTVAAAIVTRSRGSEVTEL